MNDSYIPRNIEPVLRRVAAQFPSFTLTGPRQSGKTTLLKRLFGSTHRYVSMDIPGTRAQVKSDPEEFFRVNPPARNTRLYCALRQPKSIQTRFT